MNSIELMVHEHTNILRMLMVVRKACHKILLGDDICYEDFEKMIDFIRSYADAHHHGKEEKFLFKEMETNLGSAGKQLVRHGMLVEHDLGRLFISELNDALEQVKSGNQEIKLDIIANAIGYANLLTRHISKEDQVVYTFAQRELSKEIIDTINKQTEDFEQ
ncbi:MAG: hemerythrin domain-containing protein, partial [Clostridiaceae bacterium]|nr:hemerythrin domain-containing protein [Clostridiaceae bacterium]